MNRTNSRGSLGFTLLEVMIVLGIISSLIVFGIQRARVKKPDPRSSIRNIAVLSREVRNKARVKNRTYRIVFSMPAGNERHSYWVESAEGSQVAPSEETLKNLKYGDEETKKKLSSVQFAKDETLVKKARELPEGIFFGGVETARLKELQSEGEAFIYYSPQGLVETALIQVTDRKSLNWTLVINSLTGHVDLVDKAVTLKEISRE